jgi:2-polyprenyl-6-methoxyphenol hydroxylase-like FAD-dependent oxidoreductase
MLGNVTVTQTTPTPTYELSSTQQSIIVLGSGIAGLAAALALSRDGHTITVLDRDAPPPATSADEAFTQWNRKGVGHVRHSHAFLAVLYQLLRDSYPDLLQRLLDAGCRELTFEDGLPATLRDTYEPSPDDQDLTILTSRRTTLEFVIRGYVAELPNVTLETGIRVRDLVFDTMTTPPTVTGVMAETDTTPLSPRHADIVIDATGRTSQVPSWLAKEGITPTEETEPCGILYFTRHYRLKPGCEEPSRGTVPGAGDLGYLKYGVFPADNGCFSITLAVPEIETGLRMAMVDPAKFDAACMSLPGIADWVSPSRSDPASKVLGMGKLASRWRSFIATDDEGRQKALVANFFAIGDAAIRTNPLYGRGCSCAFVEAHALAETLQSQRDPEQRAITYADRLEQAIRPYYDSMVKQDKSAMRQAERGVSGTKSTSLKGRLMASFAEDAITPAVRGSTPLLREAMKGFHMLEPPMDWLRRPGNILRILWMWVRPKATKKHLYPPKLGPERDDMHLRLDAKPATA